MGSESLDAFFHPERIAIIGASSKPGKIGYELLVNTGFYIIDRCSSMAAIFAEFRGPLRTSFAFDEQKKFMVGFRYLF